MAEKKIPKSDVCSFCKNEFNTMPHTCKFCNKVHCSDHLLPENHNCQGLKNISKNYFSGLQHPIRHKEKEPIQYYNRSYKSFPDEEIIKETKSLNKIRKRKSNFGRDFVIFFGILIILFIVFQLLGFDIKEKLGFQTEPVSENSNWKVNFSQADVEQDTIQTQNSYQDKQITECLKEFNDCKEISSKKFNFVISLNDYKKIDKSEEAQDYYRKWSSPLMGGSFMVYESDIKYPSVFLAYSVETFLEGNKVKVPGVAICSSNNKILDLSKTSLGC